MRLTLRVDAGPTIGFFDALAKGAPKAIAIAVNRTADDGLAIIRRNVKERFTIRTLPLNFVAPQTLPKALQADHKRGKLWALLETAGAGRILNPFETGEPHGRDRLGRPVAVPSTSALRISRATVIPRKLYPGNLGLQRMMDPSGKLYYATGKGAKARGIAGPRPMQGRYGTFLVNRKDGRGQVILQRTGNGPARLLWTFKDSVPRPPRLGFYDGVQAAVDARWAINMQGAWDFVVRDASRVRTP